jgi:hypothetical protein
MNEPTIRLETRPEVSTFVEKVRERLADLSDEEREELVGGLEADIHELVEDGGSVAELGDPRAYADELRGAAGIERPAAGGAAGLLRGRGARRAAGRRVEHLLDAARRRWSELTEVTALSAAWDLATTLRPVWWVLRAWVALQLFDIYTQGGDVATPLPTLGGPVVGSLVWLVAVVVSVQIGRNRIWPGSGPARTTLARLVLLGLNAFAMLMTPAVLGQFPASGTWAYAEPGHFDPEPGLRSNSDTYVENVFPYDAQGNPLTGVQLFDQDGRPLNVARFAGDSYSAGDRLTVTYPWFNGEQRLYNVFPLPRREQSGMRWGARVDPGAWTSANPPFLPSAPLAVVPPATLPGTEPTDEPDTQEQDTQEQDTQEQAATAPPGERDSEKQRGR